MPDVLARGRSFARRLWLPRAVGLVLSVICILSVQVTQHVSAWLWLLLLANGLLWSPLAYLWAIRSKDPYRAEMRNLLLDCGSAGFWAASMGFNLLPSVTLLAMTALNMLGAGGVRFWRRGVLAQLAGILVGLVVLRHPVATETTTLQIYACLPMIVGYPWALGWVSYRLAQELSRRKQELELLNKQDGMTGLHNRTHWDLLLQREFARCKRSGAAASLVMIDLDNFKAINDRFGHQAGDEMLRQFSGLLARTIRTSDLAGRFGGDEFGILLPDTSPEQALELVRRLQERLHDMQAGGPGDRQKVRVGLSCGIAGFERVYDDVAHWLQAADFALYRAKAQGRGRAEVADSQGVLA
ncbi:diguanylate cyclase [Pseudomonas oryzihabitans]|uniref:diguanylate cyclase n=2 Tax=Pseudomonas TaxID=286 RepID=UPI002894785F|nr:diguanylate cyclase [Pseudomonas oryzihabitans]MDT3720225.1 diguanylate cyclase [Pseudomonas oryzihabitans]